MPSVDKYLALQQAEHDPGVSPGRACPPPHHHQHHNRQTTKSTAVGREQALAEASSAIMNKAALLTSSTHEPALGGIRHQRSDIVALFGPTLDLAVRFQRLLAVASSLLLVYGHVLAASTLTSTVVAARLFAYHSAYASKMTLLTLRRSARTGWNCKRVRRIRKKLFMEFATTILGPGGHMLIIIVFWPGWFFILGLALAFRMVAG
ncbi:hypothetical protein CMUS01_02506 [Colletotrichum musicola]|uniref:Uncharacterized protein n=1 Tax=Colletotrichum musicola TaxID=2175873 RepID=A0A8H6NUT9_9PEZI|nr:hypothetical protein CMUS01_02506 [Colletotrichum musicola]